MLTAIETIEISAPGRVTRSALEQGELPTGDELLEAWALNLFFSGQEEKLGGSTNGGTPIARWFISWKVPWTMDDK